jgi:hypothetical protein
MFTMVVLVLGLLMMNFVATILVHGRLKELEDKIDWIRTYGMWDRPAQQQMQNKGKPK